MLMGRKSPLIKIVLVKDYLPKISCWHRMPPKHTGGDLLTINSSNPGFMGMVSRLQPLHLIIPYFFVQMIKLSLIKIFGISLAGKSFLSTSVRDWSGSKAFFQKGFAETRRRDFFAPRILKRSVIAESPARGPFRARATPRTPWNSQISCFFDFTTLFFNREAFRAIFRRFNGFNGKSRRDHD